MNFDLGNYTAKTEGAKVTLDTAYGGKGDVTVTFDAAFIASVVFLSEPPANFKGVVNNWIDGIIEAARANALVEGLTPEQAWEDFFEERLAQMRRVAAQRMKRGKEFQPFRK